MHQKVDWQINLPRRTALTTRSFVVRLIEFPEVIRGGRERKRRFPRRPFWLCNYACSVAASARREGRARGASTVNSSWPRHYRGCSFFFFLSGPSSLHSHSLISFGHPSNSLFFSLRLPPLPSLQPSWSLPLPPHSALAANPFPATQSGQASRWKGAINNCIRIYDVLYGRGCSGRCCSRKNKKEKLTTTLPSYFPWQIAICAKSLPPTPPLSCRLSQSESIHCKRHGTNERNGNETRGGRRPSASVAVLPFDKGTPRRSICCIQAEKTKSVLALVTRSPVFLR